MALREDRVPRQRVGAVSMSAANLPILALDMLGATLKLAWRALAAFGVIKAVLTAMERSGVGGGTLSVANVRTEVAFRVASFKAALRKRTQPKQVAAEKEEEEAKAAAERRAATAKEAQAEADAERMAALQAEATRMAEEKVRLEKEEKENAERKKVFDEAQEAKRAAKEAEEKAVIERELARKEHMKKVKEKFDRIAREEAEAAAAQKAEEERLEAERLAAIEAAKTPEQRAAEAAAAAAAAAQAKAEAEAAAKREAEAAEAAEAAAEAQSAAVTKSREPVGEGYMREADAAAPAATIALLGTAAAAVGEVRPLALSDLHSDMQGVLTQCLEELEGGFEQPAEADLRSQLLGFWKLGLATDDATALDGTTGGGGGSHRTVLAHYTCFSETDEYGGAPTLQTVEVVADSRAGRAVTSAHKGDFYIGKLASTSALGVIEDYTRAEYDGEGSGAADLAPRRWSCAYLSDALRVIRREDGGMQVYTKADAAAAQQDIASLLAAPVEVVVDSDEDEDDDDDRPLWQRRLDEENKRDGSSNRFGPQQSGIP